MIVFCWDPGQPRACRFVRCVASSASRSEKAHRHPLDHRESSLQRTCLFSSACPRAALCFCQDWCVCVVCCCVCSCMMCLTVLCFVLCVVCVFLCVCKKLVKDRFVASRPFLLSFPSFPTDTMLKRFPCNHSARACFALMSYAFSGECLVCSLLCVFSTS